MAPSGGSSRLNSNEINQIKSVVNQGIRSGDINSALRNSTLSPSIKSQLQKLNSNDLKTLGSIQSKMRNLKPGGLDGKTGVFYY